MARELNTIVSELRSNFVENTTIQGFYGITPGTSFEDNFSLVSFEAILFYVIGYSIYVLEGIMDSVVTSVEDKITASRSWSLQQLVANSLKFQYGDTLVYLNEKYQYATTDESLQIVKVASATEVGSAVILKVATISGTTYQELDTAQLNAFTEYIGKFKPPGVSMAIVSRAADQLKIYYHVYINPMVMNLNGELLSDNSVKPVEDAINAYCTGLDFNGIFSITELTDKIQQATGVNAPVFDSAYAKYGTQAYQQIVDFYTPNAGYLAVDPLFPLDVTITYMIQ